MTSARVPTAPGQGGSARHSSLATCGAFHGDEEDAALCRRHRALHNAFLVHDDIQERQPAAARPAEPSPPSTAPASALCAGDALALEALAAFREYADRLPVRSETVMAEVETAVRPHDRGPGH